MGSAYGMSRWDEGDNPCFEGYNGKLNMLATQSLFRLKKRSPCDLLPSLVLHQARVTWPKKLMAIMNRPLYNWRAARFFFKFEPPFEHYGRWVSWYYKMYLDCRVWDITSIYTLCVGTSVQALIVQPFRNLINSHKQIEKILFLSLNIILGRELRFI